LSSLAAPGGQYLMLPPDYDTESPEGLFRCGPKPFGFFWLLRTITHSPSADDVEAADRVRTAIRTTG
jgi:hypothetical protein